MLLLSIIICLQSITAFADTWCPLSQPEGTAEIWGTVSYTYEVGEPFRTGEVGLNIYGKKGVRYYGDNLEFWADGVPISDGYRFQTVGNKVITVKRYDKQAQYVLQVVPVLNGRLQDCTITVPMSKTAYLQSAEGFDPKDIVVTCVFTNGSSQNLTYKDLEFYAGARGMRNYKWGTEIHEGDRFQGVGDMDLIIRVVNIEIRVPFTVQPILSRTSTWALPDLKAAKLAGFLNGSQFTDVQGQLSRLDLARLSMKLYEELGGSLAFSDDSPFTDTSDRDAVLCEKNRFMSAVNGTVFDGGGSVTGEQAAMTFTKVLDKINGTSTGDVMAYISQTGATGNISNFAAPVSREQAYVIAWRLLSISPQWMASASGDFPRGTYYLTSAGNENKVAGISAASREKDAWCIMWDKENNQPENQTFLVKRKGDLYQFIVSHTGMALEVSSPEKNAILVQRGESDNANQLFKINRNADGSISLINPASGLFVGGSANQLQGGPLILWTAANDGSQQFRLVPVQ